MNMSTSNEKEAISDMNEEAIEEVLAELFDMEETPEDRWRDFLT